jgi:tRNA acetyltransferase TAN1
MSVVGNDWEALKRFNLAELYPSQLLSKVTATSKDETKPQSVTADEAGAAPSVATRNLGDCI